MAIEGALHARRAAPGTTAARLENRLKPLGRRAWDFAKRHPVLGVAAAGSATLAAASVTGAAELAAGLGAGYVAYQVLKKGKPLKTAVEEARRVV